MTHSIDAEMSEIRNAYQHFGTLADPFHSQAHKDAMVAVGRSLHAKGGADLVGRVLMEMPHAPEGFSEEFIAYLTMIWPAE